MNIKEIHIAVRQELDKTQNFTYPDFLAEQIDYWLNKAQLELINELAYPVTKLDGIDYGQKRVDDLKDIIVPNFKIFTFREGDTYKTLLPNDYMHLTNHSCHTLDFECGTERMVKGEVVKQDQIKLYLSHPFRKPSAKYPLWYIAGDHLIYETDGDFMVNYSEISYIKTPNKMVNGLEYISPTAEVQCSFKHEYMQQRIIEKAVLSILENIESIRYQSNLNEQENN